jgi:hypothetical protein
MAVLDMLDTAIHVFLASTIETPVAGTRPWAGPAMTTFHCRAETAPAL